MNKESFPSSSSMSRISVKFSLAWTVLWMNSSFYHATASSVSYYQIDPASAYTWPGGYPQSCRCAQNLVRRDQCTLFDCTCICDTTALQCDYNCCCDPDCSTDQISRFNSLGICSTATYSPSTIQHCYSSLQLQSVNPRTPMGGNPTARTAVGDALCVVQQNNVQESFYYTDTSLQPSSVFTTSQGSKDYSYPEGSLVKKTADSYYDQNDTISVFTNTPANGLVSTGSGFMQIPVSGFTGECVDSNYVKFENNIDVQSCYRTLSSIPTSTLVSQCANDFSVSRYVTNLWLARSANILSAVGISTTAGSVPNAVPVSISSIMYTDFLTGGPATDVTATWVSQSCATTGYADVAAFTSSKSGCKFPSTLSSVLHTTNDDGILNYPTSTAICQGFVTGVSYSIQHDATGLGTINTVTAVVTITDIPINPYVANGAVTVKQSFGVQFSSVDTTKSTNVNGNLFFRQRSGNPGYLQGSNILFGVYKSTASDSTTTNTINEAIGGFNIPAPWNNYDPSNPTNFGQSICPRVTDTVATSSLNFGYDVSTGCVLRLTRKQFQQLCCSGTSSCSLPTASSSSYASPITGIPYFFNLNANNVTANLGYVGIYGNADPLDVKQWEKLAVTLPTPPRGYNDATGVCSNMYTSLNYQFLIAQSGEKNNPQNKIISAQAQITSSDVIFRVPYGDNTTTLAVPLTVTVSFIYTNAQNMQGYRPPPPPVLFQIPFDVFYPFYEAAATRQTSIQPFIFTVIMGIVTMAITMLFA